MDTVSTLTSTPLDKLAAQWPILHQCLMEEILDPVDIILTAHVLKHHTSHLDDACALCHLHLAVRSGHLGIKLVDDKIEPSPQLFWEGHSSYITPLIKQGMEKLIKENNNPYLRIYNSTLYYQRYALLEEQCADLIFKHQNISPLIQLDASLYEEYLSNHSELLLEQKNAIRKVLHQTISFITGGPGTGKTYTASCLIEAIAKSLPSGFDRKLEVALAAPTGKAASHLHQKIIAKINLEKLDISSSTVHGLLNISPSAKTFNKKLSHDLILIDESSMIDLKLMTALLAALKPGARLVLLGDHRQLPPVEPGAPFSDMIATRFKSPEKELQPGYLKTCMRAELNEIIKFADDIDKGNLESVRTSLSLSANAVKGISLPDASAFQQAVKHIADQFPSLNCTRQYPDISVLKTFRLLTPLRKGLWGVESLNNALHKILMARVPQGGSPAIPILLSTNDHQMQLYNGDMGFLWKGHGYFPTSEGDWRIIPAAILPKYQYGYCLSVHKSQGSEFDRILVLLPPGSEVLGRSSLYTAVTRAKQAIEIWYDPAVLESTLRQDKLRLSNLSERIER